MRVALVSQEYPPETAKGGIGTQTYQKAHGLAALGHDVHVISQSLGPDQQTYWDGPVHVTRIPGFYGRLSLCTPAVEWLTYSAEVAVAVSELNKQTPLDLVDFPEWGAEGYIHLLNRTEENRVATVVQLHGPLVMFAHTMGWPPVDSDFYRVGITMEATCARLADVVFSSSNCSAEWCAKHYGLDRTKIPILHTGVDTQLFRPCSGPKASRPTVIFVGKIVANKGVELLLEACFRLVKDYPDLQLRMLGHGDNSLIRKLCARVVCSGAEGLLDLAGFVDRQALPRHLSSAHVFAAPSMYEGGPGFVYLEAMGCGLPVIACRGSGAAEVVIPEENGLLVPPGDVEALAQAIGDLLSDETRRTAIGQRARRYVLENADSQVCLRRLEDFYQGVAAG